MRDTREPPRAEEEFDDGFDKELMQMWQESTCPMPGGAPDESAVKLAEWVARFDRKVFWQTSIEYGAVGIILVRSGLDIASGDRPLIASLASIAAALFVAFYIWKMHRDTQPLNPDASAKAYRDALLHRLDRQVELARSVRYWYVLPAWLIFVVVFVLGAVNIARNSAESGSLLPGLFFLTIEFLLATGICVAVIWLHERYRLPKLQQERQRVDSIRFEGPEEADQ